MADGLIDAHLDHRRMWDDFYYVYPVISRRSKGVSIGVNLNPDKICNFDCVYCEVDRKISPRIRQVKLDVLRDELEKMLEEYSSGRLFEREPFSTAPPEWRRLNDIAFSGDGEPTTCPVFLDAVKVVAEVRAGRKLDSVKMVLITDSSCLDRTQVRSGLEIMHAGAYEIWAKLDAGTEAYYKVVNRSAVSFARILKNIAETSKLLPLTIQSLFLRVKEVPPTDEEILAYADRILELQAAGGTIRGLQVYTVARPTPEPWATALSREELDHVVELIQKKVSLPIERAYGSTYNTGRFN